MGHGGAVTWPSVLIFHGHPRPAKFWWLEQLGGTSVPCRYQIWTDQLWWVEGLPAILGFWVADGESLGVEFDLPKVGPIRHEDVEIALKNTRPSAHLHAHRYEKFNTDYGSQILQ
ncbi:hypothetical protein CFP56_016178 [Quercus suber]|uniref:Uncharacterized protein n=1 Tax=Quercus suber TaxID=58331 RepID=A0AAW0KQR0_QUESU